MNASSPNPPYGSVATPLTNQADEFSPPGEFTQLGVSGDGYCSVWTLVDDRPAFQSSGNWARPCREEAKRDKDFHLSAPLQDVSLSPSNGSINANCPMYPQAAEHFGSYIHRYLPPSQSSFTNDGTPCPTDIVQERYVSNHGGDAVDFSSFSISGALDDSKNPSPIPMPDGYRVVRPRSRLFNQWREMLTLDVTHNFYYERKPDENYRHQCSLPKCTMIIQGCDIRMHLKLHHPGISLNKYPKVKCTACEFWAPLIDAKSYADHVLEIHCSVSACCPYCGEEKSRGASVTRHCIRSCKALSRYKRRGQPRIRASSSCH